MASAHPYHHGNLREALIEAAVQLIAEVGPDGFTLREVARRAGVSHNAPYRHFRDKDALLAAVAGQGFEELTQSMLVAARKQQSPLERLRAAGLAYVEFALRRPQHFTSMFDASPAETGEAGDAGARAFQTLVGFIEACQAAGSIPAGDPQPFALTAWSLVHGIAKLALAGRFPGWTKTEIRGFAQFAIESSLRGLSRAG